MPLETNPSHFTCSLHYLRATFNQKITINNKALSSKDSHSDICFSKPLATYIQTYDVIVLTRAVGIHVGGDGEKTRLP